MSKKSTENRKTAESLVAQAKEQNSIELGFKKKFEEATGETVKAISLQNIGGHWARVIYTIQDGKVIEVESDEPNLKAIAIDMFKIDAQKLFMG